MLKQILQGIGFSSKEAEVYIASLQLGLAPASTIARHVSHSRVTVHYILKDFVKKGLASETPRKAGSYYCVISPDELLKIYELKCQKLKDTLPDFVAISNKLDIKSKVQFYEGLDGLRTLYEDQLSSSIVEPISAFLGVGPVSLEMMDYLNGVFLPSRVKIGLSANVLLSSEDKKDKYLAYICPGKYLTHCKVLNFDFLRFYNEINIYGGNKVAFIMFSEDELSGCIIQSKKLHDTVKSLFDLLWFIST